MPQPDGRALRSAPDAPPRRRSGADPRSFGILAETVRVIAAAALGATVIVVSATVVTEGVRLPGAIVVALLETSGITM